MSMNPRKIAYQLLEDWEQNKTFPNLALKNALRTVPEERDRRFVSALVYGVVERKITLDYFLDQCLERKNIKVPVRCVLRMGLYQIFYMSVPSSAACNTTVDLIKERGFPQFSGLVNAVLRRCDRERDNLLKMKKADFSVRYSVDPFIVDLLLDQYGKDSFVAMMEGIKSFDTSLFLFHNFKKVGESEFLLQMDREGIALEKTEHPHLFRSRCGFSLENSKAYRDGWYHIVGRHSAETALLLPLEASLILDLCAAPGGKTFILAALSDKKICSFDIHKHKIQLLKKEAMRLGHQNVLATQNDGTVMMQQYVESADFVLCDVPCSGLGMIARKPDIKYKTYSSEEFTKVQYAILKNGSAYLKSGGRLVYSTCTIDRRENERIINRFLDEVPGFSKDRSVLDQGERLYLPSNDSDGFYIAVLKKD